MDSSEPPRTSVRLTRKYAEIIDGIDLSRNQVGDLIDLHPSDARTLIAEGWATPATRALGSDKNEPTES